MQQRAMLDTGSDARSFFEKLIFSLFGKIFIFVVCQKSLAADPNSAPACPRALFGSDRLSLMIPTLYYTVRNFLKISSFLTQEEP